MPDFFAKHGPIKILLHAIFFLSGITTVLIGPVLPILINKFSLNDLQAGYFFPAQFVASLAGTYLTTFFSRRGRFLAAAAIGCLLMASGVLLMNAENLVVCVVGFSINGLGVGLTLPSINLLILEMAEGNTASALSILNFCWGAGAIVCKPFIDYAGSPSSIAWPTTILAVLLGLMGLIIIALPGGMVLAEHRRSEPGIIDAKIWTTRLAWLLAAFNFIHVGFETAIGGWLTTYSDRIDPSRAAILFSPFLFYFSFLVAGRAVIPAFFRYLSENSTFIFSLALILCGLLIALPAGSTFQLSIGAAIAGFGTSTVFPTNVSRFARIFGPAASRKATPLFLAGSLGGAIISWLIGFLSNQMASLRPAMYVLVAAIITLVILQIIIMVRERVE